MEGIAVARIEKSAGERIMFQAPFSMRVLVSNKRGS